MNIKNAENELSDNPDLDFQDIFDRALFAAENEEDTDDPIVLYIKNSFQSGKLPDLFADQDIAEAFESWFTKNRERVNELLRTVKWFK